MDTSTLRAQEAGALVREVVQRSAAAGLPLKVIHVDGMFAHTVGGDPVIAASAEVLGSQTVGAFR